MSKPPLDTVVLLAVPPLSTMTALPLVTTSPELTTPEETNCVLINVFHSLSRQAGARPPQIQAQECCPGGCQWIAAPVIRFADRGTNDRLLIVCRLPPSN
jgi:hypothetical protein